MYSLTERGQQRLAEEGRHWRALVSLFGQQGNGVPRDAVSEEAPQ
jgi:hypothetical protein